MTLMLINVSINPSFHLLHHSSIAKFLNVSAADLSFVLSSSLLVSITFFINNSALYSCCLIVSVSDLSYFLFLFYSFYISFYVVLNNYIRNWYTKMRYRFFVHSKTDIRILLIIQWIQYNLCVHSCQYFS